MQNFLFKSTREDSPLKATDFGLSDFIKPGEEIYLLIIDLFPFYSPLYQTCFAVFI